MDKPFNALEWSLVQAFLAVAETGSLSGAARVLGTSQPTLGRQIKTLEAQLGADLFLRQARGLALSETGTALIAPAQAMRTAAGQIALTAAGRTERLEGTVRITASVAMAVYHLPPIIAKSVLPSRIFRSNWSHLIPRQTCCTARLILPCGCTDPPNLIWSRNTWATWNYLFLQRIPILRGAASPRPWTS